MMIAEYRKKANWAGIACLVLFGVGMVIATYTNSGVDPREHDNTGPLVIALGSLAFLVALVFYLKSKGRSGWLALLIVFNLIGLLIIFLLKDRAANGVLVVPEKEGK